MLITGLIVFITQIIFIGFRTWNVKAIAENNIPKMLISGAVIHISWLLSIGIGAVTAQGLLEEFSWPNLFIASCSLTGGLLGSYIGIKQK